MASATRPRWSRADAGDPLAAAPAWPRAAAVLELLKPITWFAPMWAFACGVVSSGQAVGGRWALVLAGVALSGPLVCGTSQAVNDWFDRHVDAINEGSVKNLGRYAHPFQGLPALAWARTRAVAT